MSTKPVRTDAEKLRAFEQRMRQQGAAGFAAGPTPWESWDDTGYEDSWQPQQESAAVTAPHSPRKPVGSRVVTSIARLAVLALGVGIAGVYFSNQTEPQLAMHGIQPAPIVTDRVTSNDSPPAIAGSAPHGVMIDPNVLPAPAAGESEIVVVEVTADQQQNTADTQAGTSNEVAAGMKPGNSPEQAPAPAPAQPAARPEPAETVAVVQQPAPMPATVDETTPAAAAKTATASSGGWVVNLASYNRESTAQRMLQEFKDKGVTAELVRVTVNDKPMIRIRASGYESFREASDWAALLEERLELDGAWVSRR